MSKDELKLNTLERFVKHSTSLVLEEHGSCEVPAGCGGVVLHWRDPSAGLPLQQIVVGSFTGAELWVDGTPLHTQRTSLSFGHHQLAIKLTSVVAPWWFVCSTTVDIPTLDDEDSSSPALSSADDGSWRVTATAPTDDWTSLQYDDGYDDGGWEALREAPPLAEEIDERERWRYTSFVKRGNVALALPHAETLWVRKQLIIEPLEPAR